MPYPQKIPAVIGFRFLGSLKMKGSLLRTTGVLLEGPQNHPGHQGQPKPPLGVGPGLAFGALGTTSFRRFVAKWWIYRSFAAQEKHPV